MIQLIIKATSVQLVRIDTTIVKTVAYGLGSFHLFAIFVMQLSTLSSHAQTEIPGVNSPQALELGATSPVVVNGRVWFPVVRLHAYPSERRAGEIAQRIEVLAKEKGPVVGVSGDKEQ